MIGHFEVDEIGAKDFLACPAFVNDFRKFLRDIKAPVVSPLRVEPATQLETCILLDHIYVEFALFRETCEGQVATSHIANNRHLLVIAMQQVELGVQLVAQIELDDDAPTLEIRAQTSQPLLIGVRWYANRQLLAEILCHAIFEPNRGRPIHRNAIVFILASKTKLLAYLILWLLMHANHQTTTAALAALPLLHQPLDLSPAA